jgi:hypothetical protein
MLAIDPARFQWIDVSATGDVVLAFGYVFLFFCQAKSFILVSQRRAWLFLGAPGELWEDDTSGKCNAIDANSRIC